MTHLTPYCKVCHDSGKDESIYTSHFVRETTDPNSKIVCPTLISLQCRYCSKSGHTVKYCKEIKKKMEQKNIKKCAPTETLVVSPIANIFSVLENDDEDQENQHYDQDHLPSLIPCDLPPLVPYDLPDLIPIAPTIGSNNILFDDMPELIPITVPSKSSVMSYKNIIEITRQQAIKEEQEKWEQEKRKEEEQRRKELARKLEENRKKVEAFKTAPKHVFRPLNWADDSSDEE